MRIDGLHLTAYGPFTDRTLDFTAPGVHLVLGPNEAGKSTTLAAISDALFAIPVQTKAGFVHDMKSLELGLDLRADDDTTLSFRRLKKAKDDLRRSDDSVMPATELAAFLGPIDRAVFTSMYGIDHDQLVAGGADLIAGRGELGQAIFGAGSGATNLHALMTQLDERATAIFKPGGSQPTLNLALARYAVATKSARDLALRPAQYDELVERIARIEASVSELRQRHTDLIRNRDLCRLLVAVLPNLRLRLRAAATVAELAPVTGRLRTGLGAELVEVHATVDQTRTETSRLEAEIVELDAQIAAIRLDDQLLAHRPTISRLREERGHIDRDRIDRPVLAAAAQTAERAAEAIIARLRPELTLTEAGIDLAFSTTATARIDELARQSVKVALDLDSAENALVKTRSEIDDHRAQLDELAAPPDHHLLEAAVRTALAAGDVTVRAETMRIELRSVEAGAATMLDTLGLSSPTLSQVDQLAVPALATVEQFRADRQANDDNTTRVRDRLVELTDEHRHSVTELNQLLATTEAPSEDELNGRRATRDDRWAQVRSAWMPSAPDGDPEVTTRVGDPDRLAHDFEAAMSSADEVADRLRREAEAVARRAQLEVEIADLAGRIDQATTDLDQQEDTGADLDQRWAALWASVVATPGPAAAMTTWLADHALLKSQARDARRLAEDLGLVEASIAGHRRDLLAALASVDLDLAADTQLPTLLSRAETALTALANTRDHREQLTNDIARLTADERQHDLDRDAAGLVHRGWVTDWTEAVARVGLPPATTTEEAEAVLRAATDLAGHLAIVTDKRSRLADIDAYLDQQTDEIDALIVAVADDLLGRDALSALDTLVERLDAAADAEAAAQTHCEHRQQRSLQLATAVRQHDDASQRMQSLIDEADTTDLAALHMAIEQSDRLHQAEAELARLDTEIAAQSDGRDADTLELALDGRDETVLKASATELDRELATLNTEIDQTTSQLAGHRHDLTQWDGSAAAADAANDAQFALSEINALTEEYLALRLAAAVLRDQIAAYRDEHQAPILQRAAPWFARLTCGAFIRLDTDLDDKGTPMLEAIRPNGDRVGVAGMSEGTCDQLYLALRLAALAEAATTQEPFPLVLDDLLMTFDDARARAAFEILGELSGTFQVLLFTHHQHLLDLAIDTLGDQLTHHQLDARDLTVATPSRP